MAEILAWVNAVLGYLLMIFALRYVCRENSAARWLKIATALLGAYWGSLYVWVALTPPGIIDPVLFGQVFVRPAFTISLAVMAGGAIYRWRSDD